MNKEDFVPKAIYDVKSITKIEPGMFTHLPSERYITYNRLLTKEIGTFIPGLKKSQKLSIARDIMDKARENDRDMYARGYTEMAPYLVEISNSIAKIVESYKLPDKRKRLAVNLYFARMSIAEHKSLLEKDQNGSLDENRRGETEMEGVDEST